MTPRKRDILVCGLGVAMLATPAAAFAQQAPATPACQFILGFKTLHDMDPTDIGDCVDNQAFASNGDAQEHTTKGLLAWRKSDNWTAFTNGYTTWINGPNGLVSRLNTDRFPWEHDQVQAPASPAPTATPAASDSSTPDAPPSPSFVVPPGNAAGSANLTESIPNPILTQHPVDNPLAGKLSAAVETNPITALYLVIPSLPAKLGPFSNSISQITGTCTGTPDNIDCEGSDGSRLTQVKSASDGSTRVDGVSAGGFFEIVVDSAGNQVFGEVNGGRI